jgi:hypothetical protein
LAVSALLAVATGAIMALLPHTFVRPMGLSLDERTATLAQAMGVLLVGIGVINWLARAAVGPGLRAVLVGNLVVHVASLAVNARALAVGVRAAGDVVVHVLFAAAFAWMLAREPGVSDGG